MAKPADRRFRPGRAGALVAVVALAVAPGCHSARSFKERVHGAVAPLVGSNYDDPLAESKLKEAENLFAAGQYEKAQTQFRTLADNKGNSAVLAERARFMQAECRYARGQYPEAADTFHKVLLDFPTGAYRRDCCARMYQICDYWLDDFRDELDKRSGEKGVLRWRPKWPNPWDRTKPTIDQEGRTLETLERIHTHDVTGPTADKAIFWCGYVSFIRGNFQEADQFFSQLVDMHADSPLRPQAIAFAIQAKNNATGGASYDGRKCAEALQLVHVAEASVPELTNNPEMSEKLTRAKFAIRSQQAEKDFLMAEYYERTGHPGSAVFYYELVRRRYGGTRYSDLATERQARLIKLMQDGRPEPGNDPFAIAQAKWNELFGKPKAPDEKDRVRVDPNLQPAGGP
ncbi:MAG: tetratricopeptide repeat protein [Planctomycetes bacterium]|nr:tetratricopeptide repeat protein [Planctomycetota bacterium]